MWVLRGYQVSHDFWGRQNCSLPWVPVTHVMPLYAFELAFYGIRKVAAHILSTISQ